MIIPKSIANKDCTALSGCGGYGLNRVEAEAIKRLKAGNFDPRNEIPGMVESTYPDGKHVEREYPMLRRLEEIRVIIIKEMAKIRIQLVDETDANRRKRIVMKLPENQIMAKIKDFPGWDEPALFDTVMKAVLTKYMKKHGRHVMEVGY